jgi:hypothetical protein
MVEAAQRVADVVQQGHRRCSRRCGWPASPGWRSGWRPVGRRQTQAVVTTSRPRWVITRSARRG